MAISATRRARLPAPALPLVYFAGAHLALAVAAALLMVWPGLPGAFHYHPRMIAVVHLVTLGWISASILGAFYIVAPLALGMPFPARAADSMACALFWVGTAGMVRGFWRADYPMVGIASLAVLSAIVTVATRAIRGLFTARLPPAVSLHVGLAFVNIVGAGIFGMVLALGRRRGLIPWSPMAVASAHAHAAVLGWAVMMIIGISYRLVPMFLPAAMPTGRSLIWSAALLQTGTSGLVWSLVAGKNPLIWAVVIVSAFIAFVWQIRAILARRRPRPAALVGRDWSTWQTHVAMLYLVVAAAAGLCLAASIVPSSWSWLYGVTAIVGFVSQMVVGIEGRLLPLHAWYRAMSLGDGEPPLQSAYRLANRRLSLTIFLLWFVAVPALTAGLMSESHALISAAALLLLLATVLQALHMTLIVRRAGRAVADS